MRFPLLFFYAMSLTALLMISSFSTVSGQEPIKCKLRDKSLRAVQYRIGGFERSTLTTEVPVLLLKISVKPEQINADYLVLLARNMNQQFCKEDRLSVAIFDRYEVAVHFRSTFQDALDAFRGEYVLDRTTGEEYVSFWTIRDYRRHYDSRVRIDLKPNTSICNPRPN